MLTVKACLLSSRLAQIPLALALERQKVGKTIYFRRTFNCPIVVITRPYGTKFQIQNHHIYPSPHETIHIDRMLEGFMLITFVSHGFSKSILQLKIFANKIVLFSNLFKIFYSVETYVENYSNQKPDYSSILSQNNIKMQADLEGLLSFYNK